MIKLKQDGTVGVTGLALFGSVTLLVLAIIFGAWAFSGKQDYKNNADQKIAAAVAVATQQESSLKDKQFAIAAESPLISYSGPSAYGSFVAKYPRTWSAYIDTSGDSSSNGAAFAAYFNPGVVPSVSDSSSVFALQIEVLNQSYSDTLSSLDGDDNSDAPTTSAAYALPKVPTAVGVETTGATPDGQTGTTVILPLRTQTLELWTDGTQYLSDFNTNILPNFTFSP